MLSDLKTFVNWAIGCLTLLWTSIGTWGVIGAFIIAMPILRKLALTLKNLWKGGL